MKKILIILCLGFNTCFGQQLIKFDSLAVIEDTVAVSHILCETTFVYSEKGFVLYSPDRRVYSFLLPGTEFFDYTLISFRDMGKVMSNTEDRIKLVIYENNYKNMQIAQYVSEKGILLMRRDKMGLLFY